MIEEDFYISTLDADDYRDDSEDTILYLHFMFKNGDYGETTQVC